MKQELGWIVDAVLHHPFDQRGVQIAGDHLGFGLRLAGILLGIGRAFRGKSEFLLQLAFDRNDSRDIHAQRNFEVQAGVDVAQILAEALDYPHRITGYGVHTGPRGGDQYT